MEQYEVEELATEQDDVFRNLTIEDVQKGLESGVSDFFIIPPRVHGYTTKEKLWGQIIVDKKKAPAGHQPRKFHKDLQLEKKYKDLIEALVDSHEAGRAASKDPEKNRQVSDMVSGKGKGHDLLLHRELSSVPTFKSGVGGA